MDCDPDTTEMGSSRVCFSCRGSASCDPEGNTVRGWSDAESSDGWSGSTFGRPGPARLQELGRWAVGPAVLCLLLCLTLVPLRTPPASEGLSASGASRLHEQLPQQGSLLARVDSAEEDGSRESDQSEAGSTHSEAAGEGKVAATALHNVLSALKIAVRRNASHRSDSLRRSVVSHPVNASLSHPHSPSSESAEMLECGGVGDDCSMSRCCKDASRVCFEKLPKWATCLPECAPGVHEQDPPKFQQPWSCKMLAPHGLPDFASLFCFMAMRSHGVERDLAAHQFQKRSGIFGCDDYEVFSDQAVELGQNMTATALKHFAARSAVQGALTATWVNTNAFAEAWGAVIRSGKPWKHDWMVKVDPDTVFFPVRLKVHLQGLHSEALEADKGAGIYFRNCAAAALQLYGSLEIISHRALGRLSDRDTACDGADNARMGEDMWLQRCLDSLGVVGVDDHSLLRDGYCPVADAKECAFGPVAFHPYKAVEQWRTCWTMAVSDTTAVSLKK